ncbi:4921_t:CDS:1, partial [Dentiscutata erythropus]
MRTYCETAISKLWANGSYISWDSNIIVSPAKVWPPPWHLV